MENFPKFRFFQSKKQKNAIFATFFFQIKAIFRIFI